MKMLVFLGLMLFAAMATVSQSGQCSGVVVYRDGSKAANVKISGYVNGSGSTSDYYTDSHGSFTMTWSSSNDLEKIYVKGSTAATNIKNGSTGLRIVVP